MKPNPNAHLYTLAVLVFLLAATIRIGALVVSPQYVEQLRTQGEVRRVALSLASTGEFANPYGEPTGPTAHLSPVSPFLASLAYRIWGVTDRAEFARGILCSLCSALACGLTVMVGPAMGLGRATSVVAGLLATAAPHGTQFFSDITELDGCLGPALLAAMLLVFLRIIARGPSASRLVLFGLLAGLAILTHNSLLAPISGLMVLAAVPWVRIHCASRGLL